MKIFSSFLLKILLFVSIEAINHKIMIFLVEIDLFFVIFKIKRRFIQNEKDILLNLLLELKTDFNL
jgi:hypothetical protein